MNIIVRKSDNLIIFSEQNIFLTKERVVGNGWICTDLNLGNADMVENVTLPEDYQDGIYTFIDGEFIKTIDADSIIQQRAEAKAREEFEEKAKRLSVQADELLLKSDIMVLRCWEDSIPVPQEWINYRATLRRIKNGSGEDIPELPKYPEGN